MFSVRRELFSLRDCRCQVCTHRSFLLLLLIAYRRLRPNHVLFIQWHIKRRALSNTTRKAPRQRQSYWIALFSNSHRPPTFLSDPKAHEFASLPRRRKAGLIKTTRYDWPVANAQGILRYSEPQSRHFKNFFWSLFFWGFSLVPFFINSF